MKVLLTISAFGAAMWLWRWAMSGTEQTPPAWRAKRDAHHHGSE
ncbi:MAG TPA: hypothetical protein VK961_06935 [Chthoniobacter sp.]|nr:hypothetical protein [Chthoniobacter sp.]